MKTSSFLAVLVCVNIFICLRARAQNTDTNTADFNFVLVPADSVLDIYKKITKSELVLLNDTPQQARWVTMRVVVPRAEVPQRLPKLIEQALFKQAGVALARMDEKRVSVTYDKFDTRLDLQKLHQTKPLTIILTPKDVQTNSVRIITQPFDQSQNLVFRFANKSSEEIEALVSGVNRQPVKIMKDGLVVTESPGYTAQLDRQHNFVGMILIFTNYDQTKLAEQTLRGE
jgi:hypothetical protein